MIKWIVRAIGFFLLLIPVGVIGFFGFVAMTAKHHAGKTIGESVADQLVEAAEDNLGITIAKPDVHIDFLKVRKHTSGDSFISDFRITVRYRSTTLSSEPRDVPCLENGQPTKEGNVVIRQAISDVITQIKELTSSPK